MDIAVCNVNIYKLPDGSQEHCQLEVQTKDWQTESVMNTSTIFSCFTNFKYLISLRAVKFTPSFIKGEGLILLIATSLLSDFLVHW